MLGRSFSHYRILGTLGEGGMGVVYRAEDTLLGRQVAIKFPSAKTSTADHGRLLREARAASALNHPHIAAIYDCGEHDGQPYIVMELVEGRSLQDLLSDGTLTTQRTVQIGAGIAEALAEAHSRLIIHRDIKPSNVRVDPRGEVKVVDFGLARSMSAHAAAAAATVTAEGTVSGTPRYMAPEQVRGAPGDARSDLFSLGVVLYECLAGRPPFSGVNSVEVMSEVLTALPDPPSKWNPKVPAELDGLVLKAIEKKPEDRYGSAQEMLAALRAVESHLISADTSPTQSIVWPTESRRAAIAKSSRGRYALVAAVAVFFAGAVWQMWPRGAHTPPPEAARWYVEGTNALRDGTHFKAAQALERAVALDSRFNMAQVRLAEAWFELDYPDKAREAMLRAVGPVSGADRLPQIEQLRTQAVQSTLTGEFSAAAQLQRQIVALTPDAAKPEAYVDLGRAFEKSEKAADAIASYQEAVKRAPQSAAALLRLGVLLGRKQEAENSDRCFREAESLYRSLSNMEGIVEVLYQRGVVMNRAGRFAEADAQLEKALAVARAAGTTQQQIVIMLQLGDVALGQGDLARAEKQAGEAIELARGAGLENLATRGLINLGAAYFVAGKAADAERHFNQALEYARQSKARFGEARALLSRGSMRIQYKQTGDGMRDVEQALVFYRRGEYYTEITQGLILLGRAHRDRGEYADAARIFDEQLALSSKSGKENQAALAVAGLGSVAGAQGNFPEAVARYKEQLDRQQRSANRVGAAYARMLIADAAAQLGRFGEARGLARETLAAVAGLGLEKNFAAAAEELEIQIELSERHFGPARDRLRKLASARPPGSAVPAQLGAAMCLAAARPEIRRVCAEAESAAEKSKDSRLLTAALLASAEAFYGAGDRAEAKRTAESALERSARAGQKDLEWRAALLAALASKAAGEARPAAEFAGRARSALDALQQSWSPDDIRDYSSRPDVQFHRGLLDQFASAPKPASSTKGNTE